MAPLVQLFLRQAGERFGKNLESVEPALMQRFLNYHWPGNARELKSTIDRLALIYDGPVLREGWWEAPPPSSPAPVEQEKAAPPTATYAQPSGREEYPSRIKKLALARQLLSESGNDFTWVAAKLGINPTTLWRWRKAGKI